MTDRTRSDGSAGAVLGRPRDSNMRLGGEGQISRIRSAL